MANKSIFTTALAVLMLGGIALAQTQPSPVQPAPVKRTIVGKADVPNSNYEAITAIVGYTRLQSRTSSASGRGLCSSAGRRVLARRR